LVHLFSLKLFLPYPLLHKILLGESLQNIEGFFYKNLEQASCEFFKKLIF